MADDRPAVGELSVPRASLEDGSNHTLHIRLGSEDTPRVPEVDVHEADDGVRRCASEGGIDLDRSGRDLGKVFDDVRIAVADNARRESSLDEAVRQWRHGWG